MIFPVSYKAYDKFGWADSPKLSNEVWRRIRTDRNVGTWYGTSMNVLSPDSIELFVHQIYDNFYGGIGEIIHSEVITEFTKDERDMLDALVLKLYTSAANDELERREKEARGALVMQIRKEMFGL